MRRYDAHRQLASQTRAEHALLPEATQIERRAAELIRQELGQPNAEYLDFVHTFQVAVGGEAFEQATNVVLLRAVGGLDIAVAALILFLS